MSNGFETCDKPLHCIHGFKTDCPYCEIDRLNAELTYTKEMSNAFMDERNNLRSQLAEARAESSHLLVRIESGEAAAYEQGKAEARQEAAKEIIQYIIDQGVIQDRFDGELVYYIIDSDINELRQRYGLEG